MYFSIPCQFCFPVGKGGDVTQAVKDAENRKAQLSKILLTNELDYPILSGR